MQSDIGKRAALAQELQALLLDYWHDVDTNWGRSAGSYYTEDADFVGEAATYSGRAKIQEFYAWRVSQGARLAVHAVNNFRVDCAEDRQVKATWYLLLYAANGEPILPTHPPITISLVTDDYVPGPQGGWLCRRRQFRTLFQGGAPAHNPKL
ncbi:MAG TPA: nuclear transport factor 2 family protein [Steroidobacteraceae bacterium]|nr:nuclear transport factor 2 family protein [Steroidobacteraceae bacterium]